MRNTVGQQGFVQQNMYNILVLDRTADTGDKTIVTQMAVMTTKGRTLGYTYMDLSWLHLESVFSSRLRVIVWYAHLWSLFYIISNCRTRSVEPGYIVGFRKVYVPLVRSILYSTT